MRSWLIAGIPLAIILALVGWRVQGENAAAAKLEEQQKARRGAATSVEVAVAGPRTMAESIEAIGSVESPFTIRLSPRASGFIEDVSVREGDAVRAGQVLVKIDPREANAASMQQRASVTEARARLAEAEATASATDVGVQTEIRQARAELTSAEANLNQLERNEEALIASAEDAVADAASRVAAAEADVRNAEAEIRAAEAGRANAKTRLDRAKSLAERGFVAQAEVDNAQAAFESADAQVGVQRAEREASLSAVTGAKTQRAAAEKQLAITKRRTAADIAASRAQVEQARAALQAAIAQQSRSGAYRRNLEALRANVAAAEAQLSQAQVRVSDANLTSPIDGTVTERLADPGSLATPGQPVLVVQNLKWVIVRASIPVDRASQVATGQAATVRIDGESTARNGSVWQVNQSADRRSRQFDVLIRLDNSDGRLRPGMFGRVAINLSRGDVAVALPVNAVKESEEGKTVTIVGADDTAQTVPVTTGEERGGYVEIKTGVRPGERVVILSYSPVRDGAKVRIGGPGSEGDAGKQP